MTVTICTRSRITSNGFPLCHRSYDYEQQSESCFFKKILDFWNFQMYNWYCQFSISFSLFLLPLRRASQQRKFSSTGNTSQICLEDLIHCQISTYKEGGTMKRLLALFTVAGFLLAVPASHLIWSKAHVPVGSTQLCEATTGLVIVVTGKTAVNFHRSHGDCELPACDFANIFQVNDDCSQNLASRKGNSRKCGLINKPDKAKGTPGCPPGTF